MTQTFENTFSENRSKNRSKRSFWNGFGTAFGTFQSTVPDWNDAGTIRRKLLKTESKTRNERGTIRKSAKNRSTPPASLERGIVWNAGTAVSS